MRRGPSLRLSFCSDIAKRGMQTCASLGDKQSKLYSHGLYSKPSPITQWCNSLSLPLWAGTPLLHAMRSVSKIRSNNAVRRREGENKHTLIRMTEQLSSVVYARRRTANRMSVVYLGSGFLYPHIWFSSEASGPRFPSRSLSSSIRQLMREISRYASRS